MKSYDLSQYLALLGMTLLLLTLGCKEKDTVGTPADISGKESKTWITTIETPAGGDQGSPTKEERKQEIQFFANGSFSMRSPGQNASGKWTYDIMGRTLTLQFVGSENTESFQVLKLNDDEMTLQAGDGSTRVLEAD